MPGGHGIPPKAKPLAPGYCCGLLKTIIRKLARITGDLTTQLHVEVGAYVYKTQWSLYGYSDIVTSNSQMSVDLSRSKDSVPDNTKIIGDFHTHALDFSGGFMIFRAITGINFSRQDEISIDKNRTIYGPEYRGYLLNSRGDIRIYPADEFGRTGLE